MRSNRTWAERQADKEKKIKQREAKLQLDKNAMTFEAGKELERKRMAPVYAILNQPLEVQQQIIPLLAKLFAETMPVTERVRMLKAFNALMEDGELLLRVISGESVGKDDLPQAAE